MQRGLPARDPHTCWSCCQRWPAPLSSRAELLYIICTRSSRRRQASRRKPLAVGFAAYRVVMHRRAGGLSRTCLWGRGGGAAACGREVSSLGGFQQITAIGVITVLD